MLFSLHSIYVSGVYILNAHIFLLNLSFACSVTPNSLRLYIARQAPLSMEFSRQEYWRQLPFPSPGVLLNPEVKLMSLAAPTLSGRFFTIGANWEAEFALYSCKIWRASLSLSVSFSLSHIYIYIASVMSKSLQPCGLYSPPAYLCPWDSPRTSVLSILA